jgi:hypothetical protein
MPSTGPATLDIVTMAQTAAIASNTPALNANKPAAQKPYPWVLGGIATGEFIWRLDRSETE